MEMFLKRSCKLMYKFDVYFRILKLPNAFNQKKSINCVAGYDIIHATV